MIIGTFNGWNIIQMPSSPGFASLQVNYKYDVGVVTSPFTQQTQTLIWPGSDLWSAHATLPPMTRQQFSPWIGFLHDLQGQANVFLASLARDQRPQPQGSVLKGTPKSSNALPNLAATNQIATTGWPVNTPNVLVAGDYIQLGYRLYMVTDAVNADATGAATISVAPSIRETILPNTQIIYNAPKGLFRLAKPTVGYSLDEVGIFGFEFDMVEAR